MPLSVAYRSWLMPLWIASSAGRGSVTRWNHPPSSSRFTCTSGAWTSTSMTMVADAMPSSAASMTPVWALPWSSDWSPVSTRSKASSRIAEASAPATTDGSADASPSSSTWMARSAPLASASRSACDTRAGPAEHTTTSPPCFSLRRSPSSSA